MSTQSKTFAEARDFAEMHGTNRCISGGEKIFSHPDTEARAPGHIYSDAGIREYNITRMCEFHFDDLFGGEEEEEDITGFLDTDTLDTP